MMRTLYREPGGAIRSNLTEAQIATAVARKDGMLWLDLSDEEVGLNRHLLLDVFDFHPLAVDDALEERHVPKVDDWERYLYVGLHEAELQSRGGDVLLIHEIDIFVGRGYIVTHQHRPTGAVERLWAAAHAMSAFCSAARHICCTGWLTSGRWLYAGHRRSG